MQLQEEMKRLDAEEQEIDAEQDALRKETENVKAHNKALFERISTNQQSFDAVLSSNQDESNDQFNDSIFKSKQSNIQQSFV
jgi:predicted nuclease with TOPRIM domain